MSHPQEAPVRIDRELDCRRVEALAKARFFFEKALGNNQDAIVKAVTRGELRPRPAGQA